MNTVEESLFTKIEEGLFNPFRYVAGVKSLLLGLAGMFITAILCYFGNVHLDGVIDIHSGKTANLLSVSIEPVLDWIVLVIPLFLFGLTFSTSSIRIIDIAGTLALARFPLLIAVLITILFLPEIKTSQEVLNALHTNPVLLIKLVLTGLAVLPFIIWTVVLMYRGYSISTNLKGSKAIWSFIVSLLIAEVASKITVHFLI